MVECVLVRMLKDFDERIVSLVEYGPFFSGDLVVVDSQTAQNLISSGLATDRIWEFKGTEKILIEISRSKSREENINPSDDVLVSYKPGEYVWTRNHEGAARLWILGIAKPPFFGKNELTEYQEKRLKEFCFSVLNFLEKKQNQILCILSKVEEAGDLIYA
ncbi:MAG: hypothetical protein QXM68_02135 [Candidatus Aenigmatarchaeota archaeon]|nr:hypothetical protein [Candidatus Aenigmarchaeota archaeon]